VAGDSRSDDELVAQARDRRYDTRAFEALVRRHQGFVLANCRSLTGSAADADDLAQEVFVKAFFGLSRFEGRSAFRTWVGRIKVRHCLNHLRRARGAVMVELDAIGPWSPGPLAEEATPETHLHASEERRRVLRVLDTMPDTVRIPLLLRDVDGYSYAEIADQLGLGLSAVKMRIKRGREEFRRRYEGSRAT